MKLQYHALGALLLAFVLPAVAAGEAFQGLSWGSSEAEIKARFPTARPQECDEIRRMISQRTGLACDGPTVQPYEVAGIAFKLSFGVSGSARRLSQVSLFASEQQPDAENQPARLSMRAKHAKLRQLLVEKYGPSASDTSNSASRNGFSVTMHESRWITDGVDVSLRTTVTSRPGDHLTEGAYSVMYTPLGSGEAGKL